MDEPRIRLGYDLDSSAALTLRGAAEHLKSKEFDPEKEFYELNIQGKIRPYALRLLVHLPYEIALTEQQGRIILSTGTRLSTGSDKSYMERSQRSKIHLHTHPKFDDTSLMDVPSLYDVLHSGDADPDTILALAHPKGVVIYSRPRIDPVTGELLPDPYTLIRNHGFRTRTSLFATCTDGREIMFNSMSYFWQVRYTRQFVDSTQVIRDKASWNDSPGIERVMEKIFGSLQ